VAVASIITCCIGDDSGDSAISVTALSASELTNLSKECRKKATKLDPWLQKVKLHGKTRERGGLIKTYKIIIHI